MQHLPRLGALFVATVLGGALPTPPPQEAAPARRTVAVVLYPGVELLDFAGPGEVFASAWSAEGRAFRVVTVARSRQPLRSQGFLEVRPSFTFEDCPAPDVVVLPGGAVPLEDEHLRAWVLEQAQRAELMMSVCNGALVYGAAGLLDGRETTTHRGSLARLADLVPSARVLANRRFVDTGPVLTSAGVSAGIDAALHVVARLVTPEAAWQTAEYMEYDWRPAEIEQRHALPGEVVGESLASALAGRVQREGLEAVVGALATATEPEAIPSEASLNRLAHGLTNGGRSESALALLRLAERFYGSSVNASDSLAQALERAGDLEGAREANRRALARLAAAPARDDAERRRLVNAVRSRAARLAGRSDELRFRCAPCGRACDAFGYVEGGPCPGCPMELERDPERTPAPPR